MTGRTLDILIGITVLIFIGTVLGFIHAGDRLATVMEHYNTQTGPDDPGDATARAVLARYRVPPGQDLTAIIQEKIDAENLENAMMRMTPEAPRESGDYVRQTVTVRLSPVPGPYLSRLLNRMDQVSPRCWIESLDLTRIRENSDAMDITMVVTVFSNRSRDTAGIGPVADDAANVSK